MYNQCELFVSDIIGQCNLMLMIFLASEGLIHEIHNL